jgi:hypothetical protein
MSQYGLVDVNITDTNSTILSGHIFSKQDVSVSYTNANGSTNLTIQAAPLSTVIAPAFIDVNVTCPHLIQFTILARGILTATSNVNATIIEDGYWYGNTVLSVPPLSGVGTLSGKNNDPAIHPDIYDTEKVALILEINTVTAGNDIQIDNTNTTFLPGIYYKDDGVSGLIYNGTTLTFNADGNVDAQFFINAATFSFTNTTFTLSGGATAGNIFWVSNNGATINCPVPGIIL